MIAYFFIDTKGRRWLLMLSLALMLPFLLGTAFSFKATDGSPRQLGLTATFLVLYTMVSHSFQGRYHSFQGLYHPFQGRYHSNSRVSQVELRRDVADLQPRLGL